MGAIGEEGVRILNRQVIRSAGVNEADLAAVETRERQELERRAERFRSERPRVPLADRTVVVIDDGIATGASALAACSVARALGAARVILAVPVAPRSSMSELASGTDDVVCLTTPEPFFSVGQWYWDFSQTTDDQVMDLLRQAAASPGPPCGQVEAEDGWPGRDEDVELSVGPVSLAGHLTIPSQSLGLVVFAHGSGSSRRSPRNQYVATALNEAGLGTLLFDLLTEAEESDRANVFDIELLAERLGAVTAWLRSQGGGGVPIGYFGASTGAAAALLAAASPDADVAAVVSRGGRPDLAGVGLADVRAATLLIVGSRDDVVLDLNRQAVESLRCERRLEVVPGATHLFGEPGALEAVAGLARDWFVHHLAPAGQPAR